MRRMCSRRIPSPVSLDLDDHRLVVGVRAQREPAAARHGVARVQDQVEEHLLDAVLVAAHRRHAIGQLAPDADARAVQLVLDQRQHVGQHLVDVDLLELGAARAREVEQAVDDLGRAEALLLDLLEHLLARVVLLELPAQQLGVGRDAGERCIHLVRDARRQQAHRGHLLGVLQLLLEPHARGDVVEDQDRAAALAGRRLERRHREVHDQAAPVRRGQVQLVDARDLVVPAQHQRAAQRVEERLREHGVERLAQHLGALAAVEPLHRAVPAHDARVEVEHHDPRVEALQDVLVVVLEPAQLLGLLRQPLVEPSVHDRGGSLRRERLQRVDLLAVERVEPVLAPDAERRDQLAVHAAGEEPRQARRAERRVVVRGLVDVDGLAPLQALAERGAHRHHRPAVAGALHAVAAEGHEVAGVVGQQERHLAQPQRAADALEQPLRRALEVEVGVQVLGEPQQRLAPAVALLVEEPVERLLDARLHGGEGQHHDHRADEHDQRRVRLLHEHVGHPDGQQREPHDHRHREHVAERAPEQELDVHQPMLHHGVGERERDERERTVARELERQPGDAPERERQRVEGEEREDARGRAPKQPLHLPPRHEPARAPVRVEQHGEGEREVGGEVERLGAVERLDDRPERRGVLAGGEQGVAHRRRAAHDECGQVEHRHHPRAQRARPLLGEREAEVQEHRGQEQHRERVDPEQQPVEARERAGVGDRVDEEEERAHRVEVQCRAVGRPAQQHDGAHHEAEEARERQVVEGAHVAAGEGLDLQLEHAALALAQERVAHALARPSRREQPLEARGTERLLAVDRDEHVALADAGALRGTAGGDPPGDEALRRLVPEDAVVHQREARLEDEVRHAKSGEQQRRGDHEGVLDAARAHRLDPSLPSGSGPVIEEAIHVPGSRSRAAQQVIQIQADLYGSRALNPSHRSAKRFVGSVSYAKK